MVQEIQINIKILIMELITQVGIMFTLDIQENRNWLMQELNSKDLKIKKLNSPIHSNICQINSLFMLVGISIIQDIVEKLLISD